VIKDVKQMFELINFALVEIGEDNVVQVMIDGASKFMVAEEMLEEKNKIIFISLCNSLP